MSINHNQTANKERALGEPEKFLCFGYRNPQFLVSTDPISFQD